MVSLRETMTSTVNQRYLFVRHSLMGNTIIDLPIELIVDGNSQIKDYRVTIPKIQVVNSSLEETLISNFRRGSSANAIQNKHNGILLISTRETALRMRDLFDGKLFKGEIVSMAEKSSWYSSVEGNAKLSGLLGNLNVNSSSSNSALSNMLETQTRCKIPPQEKLKISSYLKSEGLQYQGLIGLSHILPWFITRLKNKQAIEQQLTKLPSWY
ncbi:MAG: hypothetical protein AB4368_13770 [Xenococcaceae cyanobacterium]